MEGHELQFQEENTDGFLVQRSTGMAWHRMEEVIVFWKDVNLENCSEKVPSV